MKRCSLAFNTLHINDTTALINDAPSEINTLRIRFSEDFNNVAARDDNEIFERIQSGLPPVAHRRRKSRDP